jgi:hypothetical protein
MGTRSLTFVYDGKRPVLCMYAQYDGYPSYHGKKIAEFLQDRVVVNGFGFNDPRKVSNGMGCLAASLVAEFKTDDGGFYLEPMQTRNVGEEYVYKIYQDKVIVKEKYTTKNRGIIFNGSWEKFYEFCNNQE